MNRILLFLLIPMILMARDHLLISEIKIPPSDESEQAFIEIYNPTETALSLNQVYIANYNTYFNMVNDSYSQNTAHFLVRFPDETIGANQTKVVALNGAAYKSRFGKTANYEIVSSDPGATDMTALKIGSNPILEFARGMIVLFTWDGNSDLVKDIDYFPWGLSVFNSYWMDKTGIAIDGPDEGSEASAYQDDHPRAQQQAWQAPTDDLSLQRIALDETDELKSGGNGIGGHNEATENWKSAFESAAPTPGSYSATAGDGSGTATVSPDTLTTSKQSDVTVTITGSADYELTKIRLILPAQWPWSQTAGDIGLSGSGFSAATKRIAGDTILIENAAVTDQMPGEITITQMTAPQTEGSYGFEVQTAVAGGSLTDIGIFPVIFVQQKLTIREIQENFSEYDGKTVTLEAVVAIGAGVNRTDHTDAYIQDESGRGINLFYYQQIFTELQRGNRVKVSGVVDEFGGTTQIGDFSVQVISTGNSVPEVITLSTAAANNTDLEGTMIQTAGLINDKAEGIGGGTNITINDGSGDIQMRIWDVSGVDLSQFSVGDTMGVRGVIDIYSGNAQLLVAYQEDVFKGSVTESADGSGLLTVTPDSVQKSQSVDLTFTFTATSSDTVSKISLTVPAEWTWSQGTADVSLTGDLSSGSVEINGNLLLLKALQLSAPAGGGIEITGLTTPAVDTTSKFITRTASPQGALTEISASPVVRVGTGTAQQTISIKEARELPVGSQITIKGVVVMGAGILRTNFTDAYIYDESGSGLNIYRSGSLDPDIKRGNLLIMKGTLDEYQGKKEIVDYRTSILSTNAPLPAPLELTTYEASTTAYEGSFVQVRGVIASIGYAGGGTNIYLDDGSGEVTVRAWDTANLDLADFNTNDFVTINGISGIYNNAGQILLGYQEDIYKPQFEENPVTLHVQNKPFVPDRGEKIKIEYSAGAENAHVTIRIYDLGGRLITTLKDGKGLPYLMEYEWDGRNHLSELVPLGAYICHLEVVDEDTGKRTEKMAPIVVGTMLR